MRTSICSVLLAFIALFGPSLFAADAPQYKYTGEVAGVVCSACSGHVKTCLSKLDGVVSVKVLRPEKEGEPAKLEVVSTSSALTKEAAVKALGEQAKYYDIRSLSLASQK